MILKEEKISSLGPLIAELETAQSRIAVLQEQNNSNYLNTTELLDKISRVTDENNALNEKIADLSKIEEQQAALVQSQLQGLKSQLQHIKKQNTALVGTIDVLTHQISQKNHELEQKNALIALQLNAKQ